jgi:hypothetical protein
VGTQTNKNPFRVVGYEVDDYNIDRDVTVKTPAVLNINTSTTTASSSGLAYEVLPPAITAVPSAAVEVTNFGLNAVSGSTSVPGIDKDGITASILYNVFKLPVTFTVTHEVPVQTAGLLERLWYRPALKETLQNIDVERLSQKLALWFGVGWDATFDFRKMVIKDKNGKEVEIEQGFVLTAAVELLAGWISLKETNQVINADDAEALLALLQQRNPGQFENTDTAQWDLAYKFALGIVYQFSEKHQLGLEVMLDKGLTNTPQTDPSSSDIMLPSNLTFSLDYKLPINERWLFNPATSLSINFTPDEVFCNLHAKLAAVWTPTDKLMLTPRYEFYYGHRGSEDTSMKHTLGLGLGLRFAKNLLFQASMDGNVQFKSFLSDPVWGFGARLGILWTF